MRFIDRYFYAPNTLQIAIAIALLPFSLLYFLSASLNRKLQKKRDFQIPIISIGNIVLGGAGKTPLTIELAKEQKKCAVILRGYGRDSRGLRVVSEFGKILCDVKQSGDEAQMIANALPNASVIVSENRADGILKAKELGAECVFLDDGFRFNYKKLNIVLRPQIEPFLPLCLPSGAYRESPFAYKSADFIAIEGIDFIRKVKLENPTKKMLLLSAIAHPARLLPFIAKSLGELYENGTPCELVGQITLKDHSNFDLNAINAEFKRLNATSLLITAKDEVKLKDCHLPLSFLRLNLEISPSLKDLVNNYIKDQNAQIQSK